MNWMEAEFWYAWLFEFICYLLIIFFFRFYSPYSVMHMKRELEVAYVETFMLQPLQLCLNCFSNEETENICLMHGLSWNRIESFRG
jgi:uncharacterized membrane protein YhaH (DUF805 family)